ncbi:hypothetical protein V4P56_00300 [Bartonella sp. B35(2025)]
MKYFITAFVIAMIYAAQGTSLIAAQRLALDMSSTVSSKNFQVNFVDKELQASVDVMPVAFPGKKKNFSKPQGKVGRPRLSARNPMGF